MSMKIGSIIFKLSTYFIHVFCVLKVEQQWRDFSYFLLLLYILMCFCYTQIVEFETYQNF